jgi:hypothetical protein
MSWFLYAIASNPDIQVILLKIAVTELAIVVIAS